MLLFPYSFFNFSASQLPPSSTRKYLSFVQSPFAASSTITQHFSCPVVFTLTFFSQQSPMLYLEPYPTKQGILLNVIISADWYEYFIRSLLTHNMRQCLLLKGQDLSALQIFLFATISQVVSRI